MTNPKYEKGVRFERELVNEARGKGCLAFRSAGSKSQIDVCIVNIKTKRITFIQAKTGKASVTKNYKKDFENLSGIFDVSFKVINRE